MTETDKTFQVELQAGLKVEDEALESVAGSGPKAEYLIKTADGSTPATGPDNEHGFFPKFQNQMKW